MEAQFISLHRLIICKSARLLKLWRLKLLLKILIEKVFYAYFHQGRRSIVLTKIDLFKIIL